MSYSRVVAMVALCAFACGGDEGSGVDGPPGGGDGGGDGPGGPDGPPGEITGVIRTMNGTRVSDSAPEYATHAVRPGTEYLVWVAAFDENASGGMQAVPKDYDATLCAATYTPAPGTCVGGAEDDVTNDVIYTPDVKAETIGATAFTICGTFDAKPPMNELVDADWYRVGVPGGDLQNVHVRMRVDGIDVANETAIVEVRYVDDQGTPGDTTDDRQYPLAAGTLLVDHAVASSADYPENAEHSIRIGALLRSATMPPGARTYQIDVVVDDREARCAAGAPTTYSEMNDGPANTMNDFIHVTFGMGGGGMLSPDTTDVPEATGAILDPAATLGIHGVTAAGTDPPDVYLDRDSFQIQTGAATNEVSFRVDWAGADCDVDFYLFEVVR